MQVINHVSHDLSVVSNTDLNAIERSPLELVDVYKTINIIKSHYEIIRLQERIQNIFLQRLYLFICLGGPVIFYWSWH